LRVAGVASTLPLAARGMAMTFDVCALTLAGSDFGVLSRNCRSSFACGDGAVPDDDALLAPPASSMTTMTAPTAQVEPSAARISLMTPDFGDGISTVALSVMTSTIGW